MFCSSENATGRWPFENCDVRFVKFPRVNWYRTLGKARRKKRPSIKITSQRGSQQAHAQRRSGPGSLVGEKKREKPATLRTWVLIVTSDAGGEENCCDYNATHDD